LVALAGEDRLSVRIECLSDKVADGWTELYNEGLQVLLGQSKRVIWAGHAARMKQIV
jgi:hypothetical protein